MPFLYVCCRSLELSIKLRIRFETQIFVSGHKPLGLYSKLINSLTELKNNTELSVLVDILNEIDDDGCKLRYSKDKGDKMYQEKPTFIKADKILQLTKKVCNILIEPIQNV